MNVHIEDIPAARYLDQCTCGGFVTTGHPTVWIEDLPVVRSEDTTTCGGVLVVQQVRTLVGEETFEDQEINDIVRRLDEARENLTQKILATRLEERALEHAARQHQDQTFNPTQDPTTGVPRNPQEEKGPAIGYGVDRLLQHGRVNEARAEEGAARRELGQVERELGQATDRRFPP